MTNTELVNQCMRARKRWATKAPQSNSPGSLYTKMNAPIVGKNTWG